MATRKFNSTNYVNQQKLAVTCPMQYAMQLLGGRWKIVILWYIEAGLNRFSVLRRRIPDVTPKMLTQQLRELEADGFIVRSVLSGKLPHVEYYLSERAKNLMPVLAALNEWAVTQSNYTGERCVLPGNNQQENRRAG